MLDFLNDKKDCVGCGACVAVCPVSCISWKRDEEGFDYPVAGEDCVSCGKCERVCPSIDRIVPLQIERKHAYAAIARDDVAWEGSASGGAFYCLADALLDSCAGSDHPTTVFGALWNGLSVRHEAASDTSGIAPMQKSKYVQSDTSIALARAAADLSSGKTVLYTGTPCQVAAARKLLGDHERLYFIDLVCHGVGSPGVFQRYLEELSERKGKIVISYSFRHKARRFGNIEDHRSLIVYEDGKIEQPVHDLISRLFLKQLCLRPSCGEGCPYRDPAREGDVTLADLKGKGAVCPDISDDRQYSCVIVNTDKGARLMDLALPLMRAREIPLEAVTRYNPLYDHSTKSNPEREKFFSEFVRTGSVFSAAALCDTRTMSTKRRIYGIVPRKAKWAIRRLLGALHVSR